MDAAVAADVGGADAGLRIGALGISPDDAGGGAAVAAAAGGTRGRDDTEHPRH